MSSRPTGTFAARLLEKVVASKRYDRIALAAKLDVTTATLDEYVDGRTPIPVDQRLRLADLVIAAIPRLASAAYRVRAQSRAEMTYDLHETVTHLSPPVSRFR